MLRRMFKRSFFLSLLATGVVAFILGLGAHGALRSARAETPAPSSVTLGMSASEVRAILGAPVRISFSDFEQTWYFADKGRGGARPKVSFHFGVVVRVN